MTNGWPMVPLSKVLTQYQEYIVEPEPKLYPKLSVKLYGRGVVLDEPADGSSLKMKRHQIAKRGQVILSEIEPKYLQAIFMANYLQDQLDAEAKGTTGYAAVRPKNLLAATIPVPPLTEQRLVIAREIGDRRGEGNALWNMSLALDELGERARAVECAQASLKIYEEIESPYAERARKQLAEWDATD